MRFTRVCLSLLTIAETLSSHWTTVRSHLSVSRQVSEECLKSTTWFEKIKMAEVRKAQIQDLVKVVLFEDGPGFVFIEVLDTESSSDIFLVRSLADGLTYVRKQTSVGAIQPNEAIQSKDVRYPVRLSSVSDIAQPFGWAEYLDASNKALVSVGYWQWYEHGTLGQIEKRFKKSGLSIPISWIWSIFYQKLWILVDVMKSGVIHLDSHVKNWFVKLETSSDPPRLLLGDWGNADMKESFVKDGHEWKWWDWCQKDIRNDVTRDTRRLLLQGHATGGNYRQYLDSLVQERIQPYAEISNLISILNKVDDTDHALYSNKQEWLDWLRELADEAAVATSVLTSHPLQQAIFDTLQPRHDIRIPGYNEDVQGLVSDEEEDIYSAEEGVSACADLQSTAVIDISTHPYTIVSVESRADNFNDIADIEAHRPEWHRTQRNMRERVKQLRSWKNEDATVSASSDYNTTVE